jgi:probable F420-dependent oxidoreductase
MVMAEVQRPFRFSIPTIAARSRTEWMEYARKAESSGYALIVHGDHPAQGGLAPMPAFTAAADVTSTLRFGGQALNNDLRHPVMLAHEAATLDLLSEGRLELGLGAGWSIVDYRAVGLTFESGATRLARLAEAVSLIKQLVQGGPVTFNGEHYHVEALDLQIPPAQHPHMPLFIGGGRRRLLTLAAREADIVGLDMRSQTGVMDLSSYTAAAMDELVGWVRQAAGERIHQIELQTLVHFAIVTDDRKNGLEQIRTQLAAFREWGLINDVELGDEELLTSPHVLVGTVSEIVETLQERRTRYGISHITLFGGIMDNFSPVVEQLAGQ